LGIHKTATKTEIKKAYHRVSSLKGTFSDKYLTYLRRHSNITQTRSQSISVKKQTSSSNPSVKHMRFFMMRINDIYMIPMACLPSMEAGRVAAEWEQKSI
jgi:hypothetical protein